VELIKGSGGGHGGVPEKIKSGEIDAAFVSPPNDLHCRRKGLRLIAVPSLPMIHLTSIFTTSSWVAKNEETVINFLKGLIEGIAFFKTNRRGSLEILERELRSHVDVKDQELLYHIYDQTNAIVEKKPYPTLEAIANVYEEAKRFDPKSAEVSPLSLWNLHYVRRLDDQGFIDRLYD
jgi:ABC-type nitrate/sulfonate/bicarbonate transport system substrate-binding protein